MTTHQATMTPTPLPPPWKEIDTVLLDLDGTLLDRHFDDYFWEQYVPEVYAGKHGLSPDEARGALLARYKVREGTLDWTDLDYWSRELGLDIPAMKIKMNHLIRVHPHVIDFLRFCGQAGKEVILVTNAHSKTLEIKLRKTRIGGYFDGVICSEEIGLPKEEPGFWARLNGIFPYDPGRTLLAEDSERILTVAEGYGIRHLILVARPSSTLAVRRSERFASIVNFAELLPPGGGMEWLLPE